MSNALRLSITLALTLSPAALAYTRTTQWDPTEYEGVYDIDDVTDTTLDTGGGDETAGDDADQDPGECQSDCRSLYNSCYASVPQTYQECRANAYEHVNWLIQYAQIIDFTMLDDMLAACEEQAALSGESCYWEYDMCLTGC